MKRFHTASKRVSRLLTLLLALTMLILCACSEEAANETSSNAISATPSETSSVLEEGDVAPEVIDLNGREINVLSYNFGSGSSTILGYTGEVLYSDEENSTSIDVQKKAVIDFVETEYNCVIGGSLETFSEETIQNLVLSSTYTYDVIFSFSRALANMAVNGVLTDLNTVKTLQLSNSWWDQNAVEQLSIGKKLFFVNGDINTYDDLGTWCMLFNKSLKERLNIEEDFYQLARDGDWTLDRFIEICQGITTDITGDGIVNEFDQWALGTETYNVFVHALASGQHIVEKDNNDLPYLTLSKNPERLYNALDKIITFYQSPEVMVANGGKYNQYANVWEETINKSFREGRELFYMAGLINLGGFRTMEDDIGVLPIPKTFADQDTYYHTVSMDNSSYLAIPYGLPDIEDVALVVEALAMKSKELVTPAFYETQLKYRDFYDDDSGEMLDLIFATRSFDLCPIYNWGGVLSAFMTIDTNYASRFDSLISSAETAMQNTVYTIWTLHE